MPQEGIMMFFHGRVHFYSEFVDMRKSINGLSCLVEDAFESSVFSGHLFVFCNRSRTMIKVLYWEGNGFCLWMKRLEKQRFQWPKNLQEGVTLRGEELQWLLQGLDLKSLQPHQELHYQYVA